MLQTEENIKEADEIFREILRESRMTDGEIDGIGQKNNANRMIFLQ